ncbi:hypothetical protein GBA52_001016 [Prunus armeniaca]|nr:hypothetical protein GBA52_001016 [Prunus armeniaca]
MHVQKKLSGSRERRTYSGFIICGLHGTGSVYNGGKRLGEQLLGGDPRRRSGPRRRQIVAASPRTRSFQSHFATSSKRSSLATMRPISTAPGFELPLRPGARRREHEVGEHVLADLEFGFAKRSRCPKLWESKLELGNQFGPWQFMDIMQMQLEQLLKQGRQSREEINTTYKIMRRIEAEELTLDASEIVITSTRQEIESQWRLYDGFDPILERKLRARIKRGVSCHGGFMPRMVVLDNGLLVDPHDQQSIADALLKLVWISNFGARCRQNGLKTFTFSHGQSIAKHTYLA